MVGGHDVLMPVLWRCCVSGVISILFTWGYTVCVLTHTCMYMHMNKSTGPLVHRVVKTSELVLDLRFPYSNPVHTPAAGWHIMAPEAKNTYQPRMLPGISADVSCVWLKRLTPRNLDPSSWASILDRSAPPCW